MIAVPDCVLSVHYDEPTGWLTVAHDGTVTWDQLQAIKTEYMGADAVAIEVYPAETDVVNKATERHLWRWSGAFPNLMEIQVLGEYELI